MGIHQGFGTRVRRGGLLAAVAVLSSAGIALASNAVAGRPYAGTYKGLPTDHITFTVNANGKKVIDVDANTPFHCSGGCGGVENATGGTAKISKKGTFKVTIKILGPGLHPTVEGSDTVKGKFLKHGKAKGTVTSHFLHGSSGETVSWTATEAAD